ncbi:MAG: ABC transporter permease [Candidatus Nomurabacteria bacterium]|nr:MAG: ABC transporter permease [Candidatus Nomurabacteria bacterium]HRV75985.1 ABC transporter permease [Candidatus Saccharimonadales bacterium]
MIKKELFTIWVFAKLETFRTFRDKVALFFTFVFPLIFLFIFGGIFGGNNSVKFKVAVLNESKSDFSQGFVKQLTEDETFDIDKESTSLDLAKAKMDRGQLDATIVLPQNFGEKSGNNAYPSGEAQVIYNQNNEQAATTLTSVLGGAFEKVNAGFVKSETPFSVKAISTAKEGQRRFDYTFAGLVGFSILGLGIFGPTTVFPQMKQKGILKRLHTTTLKVRQYFIANALSSSIIGIVSVAMMFVAARIFFDLNMNGDYLSLMAIVVLGTITLFGIGLAIGGWAKNENQAAPLAQIVTFPMMFLSGVFFPRFAMPEILQRVSSFFPLTPVVDGVRLIVTEGRTIFDLGPQVGLLAAWIVIIYTIAFRAFRWE